MTFHLGQKVVCISEEHNCDYVFCVVPKKGNVYTICAIDDADGLRFSEIRNALMTCINTRARTVSIAEPSFWPEDFRPLVERETDISIFKKMLPPKRQRVTAD